MGVFRPQGSKAPTTPVYDDKASLKDAQGNLPFGYGSMPQQPVKPVVPVIPQIPQIDIQSMLNQMKQAQSQAIIGKLDTAKNNALSGIATRRTAVEPNYQGYKNNASTQNYMSAKNFAEYMANRGTGTGTNAQAALLKNMGLQNQMSSIDLAKDKTLQGLSQDEALINQNYNSDLVSAQSGIEADAMKQSISAMQQAQQQAIADQRYKEELARQKKQDENSILKQNIENDWKQKSYENDLKRQEFDQWYKQEQLKLQQNKSSNTGSGNTKPNYTNEKGEKITKDELILGTNKAFDNLASKGFDYAYAWLNNNQNGIVKDLGLTEYNKLVKKLQEVPRYISEGD